MANRNPSPATRFSADNHGRAKQKGARDRLSTALLTAFASDFERNGEEVISQVRQTEPATYLRIAATIIPKEIDLGGGPLEDWTDDDLDKGLAYLRAQISKKGPKA